LPTPADQCRGPEAFKKAIDERNDQPDIVVFVETDGSPMYGWMFKEADRFGDDIPMLHGHHCYTEGEVRRAALTSPRRP
jgi:hypothetical protein